MNETHLVVDTTIDFDLEVLPGDANMLVLETSSGSLVVRRTQIFPKVEGLLAWRELAFFLVIRSKISLFILERAGAL